MRTILETNVWMVLAKLPIVCMTSALIYFIHFREEKKATEGIEVEKSKKSKELVREKDKKARLKMSQYVSFIVLIIAN